MMQPVRVLNSGLTNRIFAVRRYKELGNQRVVVLGGAKDDVTQEALHAARIHIEAGCTDSDCACQFLTVHSQCGKIRPIPEPGEVVRACMWAPRHDGLHSDGTFEWDYSEAIP